MIRNKINRTIFNRRQSYWLIAILLFTLSSCDTWIFMQYSVKNKSDNEVKLLVPFNRVIDRGDSLPAVYQKVDSTLIIKSDETILLSGVRILYPSRRSFYKNNPGLCGIKRVQNDTIVDLGCSKKEWKYRKGQSMLILR